MYYYYYYYYYYYRVRFEVFTAVLKQMQVFS